MSENSSDFTDMDWNEDMNEFSFEHDSEQSSESEPSNTMLINCPDLEKMLCTPRNKNPWPVSQPLVKFITSEPFYLHALIYKCRIPLISELLQSGVKNLPSILNWPDHVGNTPLMLAVKLCSTKREYLSIVHLLLDAGSDPKRKDFNGWTPMDEAVYQHNRELVVVLFNHMHQCKSRQWTEYKQSVQGLLAKLPDFYLEFIWEFRHFIPFVKAVAPHDECKIWKVGSSLKMESTFVGWKKLKTKRRPMSFYFNEDFYLANHSKHVLIQPLEPLDEEEKSVLIEDIIQSEPIQGDFQIHNHELIQATNWRGHLVQKQFGQWLATKHLLKLSASICIKKRKAVSNYQYSLAQDAEAQQHTPKPVFEGSVKERVAAQLSRGLPADLNPKSLSLKCWVSQGFPLDFKAFVAILKIVSSSNPTLSKVQKFLENEGFLSLIPDDSFPIKIEIPMSFGIRATLRFKNFQYIQEDARLMEPPRYQQISRKEGQKILTRPKKRLFLANFVL